MPGPGTYRDVVETNRSAFAVTSRARDLATGREVVIMCAAPDAPEELASRVDELRAHGGTGLSARCLVKILYAGRDGEGVPQVVTELVRGPTLRERMSDGPAMSLHQAVAIVIDVLRGVEAAHAAGIAHGDIEPGNVRLLGRADRPSPRLIGFGLNRALVRAGLASTPDPRHLETLAYGAPAQAAGSCIADGPSDVYSVAAVLYELVSGRAPRVGSNPLSLRRQIASAPVTPIREASPELPAPLAEVIDRALLLDPEERFTTASELLRALRVAVLKSAGLRDLQTPVGPRPQPGIVESGPESLEFEEAPHADLQGEAASQQAPEDRAPVLYAPTPSREIAAVEEEEEDEEPTKVRTDLGSVLGVAAAATPPRGVDRDLLVSTVAPLEEEDEPTRAGVVSEELLRVARSRSSNPPPREDEPEASGEVADVPPPAATVVTIEPPVSLSTAPAFAVSAHEEEPDAGLSVEAQPWKEEAASGSRAIAWAALSAGLVLAGIAAWFLWAAR